MELNKIYNEDCLVGMAKLPEKSVDLILCDLPYGTTACFWDSVIPFDKLWEQYERLITDTGVIVLTASQPFTTYLIQSNIKLFKYSLVWVKSRPTNHVHAKNAPMKKHEDVLVFSKGSIKHSGQPNRMTYNPQGLIRHEKRVKGKRKEESDVVGHKYRRPSNLQEYKQEFTNYPTSVLEFANEGSTVHPTQKPVALFEYLIRTYTDSDSLVLDNCMGSGTTAIAAINAGRKFIGFELDEKYYKIACNRIAERMNSLV